MRTEPCARGWVGAGLLDDVRAVRGAGGLDLGRGEAALA